MARTISWIGPDSELPGEVFLIRNRGWVGLYRTLKGVRLALKSNMGLTSTKVEVRFLGTDGKKRPYNHYTRETSDAVKVYRAKVTWERIDLEPTPNATS